MWVHSQLYSEAKEKKKQKKNEKTVCVALCTVTRRYITRVLTAEAVFTHGQQQQPSPPLQQHYHSRWRRFVTQSSHLLHFLSVWALAYLYWLLHVLPSFSSALLRAKQKRGKGGKKEGRKEEEKADAQAALVSSHAQYWFPYCPVPPAPFPFLLSLWILFLLPDSFGSEQQPCHLSWFGLRFEP